jgi:hypothetical protein
VTARRLNRAEYDNTVRDLLGVDLRPAQDFPVDDSGYGFDTIGDVLSLSPVLMEKYLRAADRLVRAALEPAPVPPKPVLVRFDLESTAERPEVLPADPDGAPLAARNALVADLTVPSEATYELSVIVGGRGHPDGPPAKLALLMGGKQVQVVELEADEEGVYKKRTFDVRRRLPGGVRQVGAAFLRESEAATLPREPKREASHVLAVNALEVRGPFDAAAPGRPASYARIMTCAPEPGAGWSRCARRILEPFARRAWRRPLGGDELDRLVALVELARKQGDTFERGVATALKAVLVSPHFLFRVEQDGDPARGGVRPLTAHELASRLAYFLWSSMPDDALLERADDGALTRPRALRAELRRMLASPRSAALAEHFAGQWLQVRNLSAASPDPERFPGFGPELRRAMARETTLFFDFVLRQNRPITDFIDGRYSFLNERLAGHYGIKEVAGPQFRRVELDGVERSGILTQASVLTVTSYPTRTSPVLRGLWVLENILGTRPPPPPPDVPRLDEGKVAESLSMRRRLEEHRSNPSCAACHTRMDALGFGLENYDAVGRWRTADGKAPVDAAGALPGERRFAGPAELKAILAGERSTFAECLAEKLLTYALGRGLQPADRPAVAAIVRSTAAADYRFGAMIEAIVLSPPFRSRNVQPAEGSLTAAAEKR